MSEYTPKLRDKLYTLSNQGEYEPIVSCLLEHPSSNARYGAAGVLSESPSFLQHASAETTSLLIDAVLNEPDDKVRARVLDVLLDIEGEAVLDNIVTRLELNPDLAPPDTSFPFVLDTWSSKPHAELRHLAVVGFGRLDTASSREKLLMRIDEETDIDVLRRAIEEGGEVGDIHFVSPIQQYLRADAFSSNQYIASKINRVQAAAAEALVKIGTDGAYEALVSATRSNDPHLKHAAIDQIAKFGSNETLDRVIDELDSPESEEVRKTAATGILTTFVSSDFEQSHEVREQAIEAISEDVSVDVSGDFAAVMEDSNNTAEKRNAAWLLGQIDDESEVAAETLASTVVDSDDDLLAIIAAATLSNHDPELVSECIAAIRDAVDDDSKAKELVSFVESDVANDVQELD
ncbi:HEAT repeat domain-containing protein [Halonotius terrestris]|uniref:HEAT repeat domain-containing protein n=1 Tax=Halonotius terrestris TaxID=2487750 RepID=A0A8J8P8X2_9EURY|nr:HEAT repeat domain-containing protein [Halonotius terrestris]TQQ79978.1 HEAT repeat domain-containing protein [Halonotius terrestris]